MRIDASHPRPSAAPAARTSEGIAETLRERIQTGFYKAQSSLPSERDLSEDLHVHRRVIRKAIDDLAQEGLVYRRPNCRPIVGQPIAEEVHRPAASTASSTKRSSKFVALIMWHGGGPLESAGTAQSRIFWGVNHALAKVGHHAVFLDLGGETVGSYEVIGSAEDNAKREAEHLQYAMDRKFGGVIFYPYAYMSNHGLIREVSRRMPLVLLDRKIPGIQTNFVGVANHQAIRDMTTALIRQGHRRIAYVTRWEPINSVQDRLQGYLNAIYPNPPDPEAIVQEMILPVPLDNDATSWPVVDAVFGLPAHQRPTAAICVNDYTAVALAERLERMGLSVPGDVALTGFDNIIPALPNGTGLTSMAQPFEEIGRVAAELLDRQMHEPSRAREEIELPVRVVVRGSAFVAP